MTSGRIIVIPTQLRIDDVEVDTIVQAALVVEYGCHYVAVEYLSTCAACGGTGNGGVHRGPCGCGGESVWNETLLAAHEVGPLRRWVQQQQLAPTGEHTQELADRLSRPLQELVEAEGAATERAAIREVA